MASDAAASKRTSDDNSLFGVVAKGWAYSEQQINLQAWLYILALPTVCTYFCGLRALVDHASPAFQWCIRPACR